MNDGNEEEEVDFVYWSGCDDDESDNICENRSRDDDTLSQQNASESASDSEFILTKKKNV